MAKRQVGFLAAVGMLATGGVLTSAVPGYAVPANATISAGSLAMTFPASVTFPATTITGANQNLVSAPQTLDVNDSTGAGTGWNVTGTSTTFTSGARTLSTTATTEAHAGFACTGAGVCTLPSDGIGAYTLPAAASAPVATKMLQATADTGMGDMYAQPVFTLAIPSNVYAGTYTSTWTFSVVSGP